MLMEIVQLSDIHFGSQFREDAFDKVIDEVNSLSPDAVVITGDLTNEGLKEEYEQCKELISKINVEKIIAIMKERYAESEKTGDPDWKPMWASRNEETEDIEDIEKFNRDAAEEFHGDD